jgi:hypothetical protein
MKRLALLGVVFCLFATTVKAATYYVGQADGNDSRSCLQAMDPHTPRKTIKAGAACLAGGDTLSIRAGVYPETLRNLSGQPKVVPSGLSNSQRTVIKGYPGERPILRPSSKGIAVFQGDKTQFVTLEGLEFDFVNCPACIGTGGYDLWDFTVRNNIFRNFHMNATAAGQGGCSICAWRVTDRNWIIEDNVVTGVNITGDYARLIHGFYLHAAGAVIRRNRIDMGGTGGYAIHLYDSHNPDLIKDVVVENNWLEGGAQSGLLVVGPNNRVVNNVIYNNAKHPRQAAPHAVVIGGAATGLKMYHNTIYDNGAECIYGKGTANVDIRNNICYKNQKNVITGFSSGILSPNFFNDPKFVDPPKSLDLREDSPARTGGVNTLRVAEDYDSNLREDIPDFGAYEFNAPPPPPPPPFGSPTRLRVRSIQ